MPICSAILLSPFNLEIIPAIRKTDRSFQAGIVLDQWLPVIFNLNLFFHKKITAGARIHFRHSALQPKRHYCGKGSWPVPVPAPAPAIWPWKETPSGSRCHSELLLRWRSVLWETVLVYALFLNEPFLPSRFRTVPCGLSDRLKHIR